MVRPLTEQEGLRDADSGEDEELALAVFSGRCPADPQWKCCETVIYKSKVRGEVQRQKCCIIGVPGGS